MIVKLFGCTVIQMKALYKCLIPSLFTWIADGIISGQVLLQFFGLWDTVCFTLENWPSIDDGMMMSVDTF